MPVNAESAGRAPAVDALTADSAQAGASTAAECFVGADDIAFAQRMQPPQRFDTISVDGAALRHLDTAGRRLLIHNLVACLKPEGRLHVVGGISVDLDDDARATGLASAADSMPGVDDTTDLGVRTWQRVARRSIHDVVAEARDEIQRWTADELAAAGRPGVDVIVLDTRTPTDRDAHGTIPGSHHAPRTVIEWLVDPASGYSLDEIVGFDQSIVVVCGEGYSSSLAARSLRELGFARAGDLIGGFAAWRSAGFPIVPPSDHHTEENP